MSVQIQITKSELVPSEDQKSLNLAVVGEFFPSTSGQHDLLEFISSEDREETKFSVGRLSNGHDGFQFTTSVRLADFLEFSRQKKLKEQVRASLGSGASGEDVERSFQAILQKEVEAQLAKQVNEASQPSGENNAGNSAASSDSGNPASDKAQS